MQNLFISHLVWGDLILKIVTNDMAVKEVSFVDRPEQESTNLPEIASETKSQLLEYLEGNRRGFDVMLLPDGTDFQKKVWQMLQQIDFGKTATYAQMAVKLGDPKVIRAAASANGKNPIAIIIPCHRVIGANGELTGYAGGLSRKRFLLDHENRVANGVLSMF